MPVLAILGAIIVGFAMGLMGAGGSILTVPILVFLLGYPPKVAIATSLAVVGVGSLIAALQHHRAGNLAKRTGILFGVTAMVGTYAGARLSVLLTGQQQLQLFGLVMLLSAFFMMIGPEGSGDDAEVEPRRTVRYWLIISAAGLGVGVLTGLVGVGGGFMIVAALVLVSGLPMRKAVGTALFIIALKSAAGLIGYLEHVDIPWRFAGLFTTIVIFGTFLGARAVQFVNPDVLRRAFAAFLLVMAGFVFYQTLGSMPDDTEGQRSTLGPGADATFIRS